MQNQLSSRTCLKCGISISHRPSNTKYCLPCSKIISSDRDKAIRGRAKILKERDTALEPQHIYDIIYACRACNKVVYEEHIFCPVCGQRLKEDTNV